MQHTASPSQHRSTPWWNQVPQQLEQNLGAVMLAAGAVALLLIVSFVGVLQGAVQKGELRLAQQRLATSATPSMPVATVVVAARSGR